MTRCAETTFCPRVDDTLNCERMPLGHEGSHFDEKHQMWFSHNRKGQMAFIPRYRGPLWASTMLPLGRDVVSMWNRAPVK